MSHHIEIVEEVVNIITEGFVGPPGRTGPRGESGGSLFNATASVPLGGHRAVLLTTQGELAYASCEDITHFDRVVGVTDSAASQGQSADVVTFGRMEEGSWNWDITKPVYLSSNGLLTQTLPVAPAAKFLMVVGFPISSTLLFVNPRDPFQLA